MPRTPRDTDTWAHYVEVVWNTDPDGAWVDEDDDTNVTRVGPFPDLAAAHAWMENAFPDDTTVRDMEAHYLNPPTLGIT